MTDRAFIYSLVWSMVIGAVAGTLTAVVAYVFFLRGAECVYERPEEIERLIEEIRSQPPRFQLGDEAFCDGECNAEVPHEVP